MPSKNFYSAFRKFYTASKFLFVRGMFFLQSVSIFCSQCDGEPYGYYAYLLTLRAASRMMRKVVLSVSNTEYQP